MTYLRIPSSVTELKDGWCYQTLKLIKIEVMPGNKLFSLYNKDEFLLEKSDPDLDIYNVLLFAQRDVKEVVIPSFITRIAQCSFIYCKNLHTFKFAENSQIQTIEKDTFSDSSLEQIKIPSNTIFIKDSAFENCEKLTSALFDEGL